MSTYSRPCRTLAEHKAVVKSWRARAATRTNLSNGGASAEKEGGNEWHSEWPPEGTTGRSDNNGGGTVYEESVAATDEALGILDDREDGDEDSQQDPGPLRTVGQIKHAYRTRARQDEAESERKAVQLQFERRKRQPNVLHSASNHKLKKSAPMKLSPPRDDHTLEEATDTQGDQRDDNNDGFMTLDAQSLGTNATYRAEVLRSVRRELSAGRDVRLRARCPVHAALPDVKLALQQLCTESLLFCVRDQIVIPTVDSQQSEVVLELLARRSGSRYVD